MVQALGSCGIDAGEDWEWVKAKKYLLLGNEDENFRFYGQHREAFAGHTVYLKSENLAAEGILNPLTPVLSGRNGGQIILEKELPV